LSWDEDSRVLASEDVVPTWNGLLYSLAAILDEKGEVDAKTALRNQTDISLEESAALLHRVAKRGFRSRFPQLLLGPNCWLPFRANLILEEPDWANYQTRFGSVYRLNEEIEGVRAFIRDADPNATTWLASVGKGDTIFAKAWNTSDTIARLAALAIAHRAPLSLSD
jgi:hypothetical protein